MKTKTTKPRIGQNIAAVCILPAARREKKEKERKKKQNKQTNKKNPTPKQTNEQINKKQLLSSLFLFFY